MRCVSETLHFQTFLNYDSWLLRMRHTKVTVIRAPLGPSAIKINVSAPVYLKDCFTNGLAWMKECTTTFRIASAQGNVDISELGVLGSYSEVVQHCISYFDQGAANVKIFQ